MPFIQYQNMDFLCLHPSVYISFLCNYLCLCICESLSIDSVNQDFSKYYDPLKNLANKNRALLKMVLLSGLIGLL